MINSGYVYSLVYVNEPMYKNDPHARHFAWRQCWLSPEGPKVGICKDLAFSFPNIPNNDQNVEENTKSLNINSPKRQRENLFETISKKFKIGNIVNNSLRKRHNENLLEKTIIKKIKLEHIYNFPNKYETTTKKRHIENLPEEIVIKKIKLDN